MRSLTALAAAPTTGAALPTAARCRVRRIKVALHYRQLTYHMATTSKLLLQGEWLAAAGFAPGTVARIEVEAGRLVITPVQAQ